MTYRGHIEQGMVVFDEPVSLADGTRVNIEVMTPADQSSLPTLYDRLSPVIGQAKGLPPDAASNHDHYLYGLPNK